MAKKVAVVLGGGAALGMAHIGVLKMLEKQGIPIDIVVGTSMGGLIGAAYCSGITVKQMTDFACGFRTIHFFDVNFNISGLFSGKGVMKKVNRFLPDCNIEDMNRTFACVACDLLTESQIDITSGNLRESVRATLSIPGFFVPFYKDNMVLVDGGIKNNLPVDVAKKLGADVIIACDVLKYCRLSKKPRNAIETLISAVNSMTKDQQAIADDNADILLQPNLTGMTPMSFNKKNTLKAIKEGEKEVVRNIDKILELIN